MANTVIRLKKSSISGRSPTTLEHGELAINYTDGKLFYKDDANVIQRISGGANSFMYMNVNSTMLVAGVLADVLTVNAGDNIEINTDALTNKYTITANLFPAFRVANAAYALANDMYNVSTVVSNTAPSNPVQGKLWWNSILGTLFVYYVDPDGTTSWVEAVPNGGGTSGTGGGGTTDISPAFNVANAAFAKANSANVLAYNTGVGANNYAGVMANAANAYATSLTPDLSPVFVVANAAFGHSNTTYAAVNSAFGVINASFDVANGAYTSTNGTAAFAKANAALANSTGTFAGDLTVTGNVVSNKQTVIYYRPADTSNAAVHIAAANTKGGAGYADVFKLTNLSGGAINPDKWIRIDANGGLQIINNAYNSNLITLSDSGNFAVAGNVTMSGIQPGYSVNRPGFRVTGSGTTNNLTTTQNGTGILNSNNWSVDYNQGSYLNGTTGVFTAPVAGLYQVNLVGRNSGYSSGISQIAITKNGAASVVCMLEFASSSSMNHAGVSSVVKLAVGDTLDMRVLAGQINFDGNDNWSVAYIG